MSWDDSRPGELPWRLDSELAGCVMVKNDGQLCRLFVRKAHRGNGLGYVLAKTAIESGAASWAKVIADDQIAQRVFGRLGWAYGGRRMGELERWAPVD